MNDDNEDTFSITVSANCGCFGGGAVKIAFATDDDEVILLRLLSLPPEDAFFLVINVDTAATDYGAFPLAEALAAVVPFLIMTLLSSLLLLPLRVDRLISLIPRVDAGAFFRLH